MKYQFAVQLDNVSIIVAPQFEYVYIIDKRI